MNSPAIRELVKQAYSSNSWSKRVDGMSDSQVFAIYMRFRKDGRIKL